MKITRSRCPRFAKFPFRILLFRELCIQNVTSMDGWIDRFQRSSNSLVAAIRHFVSHYFITNLLEDGRMFKLFFAGRY